MSAGAPADLIFDLGMNNGDDTAYYLAKGYRVVAVEANPALCAAARLRFADAIADGRLVIEETAIWEDEGTTQFLVNEDNDHWSSIDPGWAGREGSRCRAIEVPTVTLAALFARHGVPHFLKIDVEGVDHIVLDQLAGEADKPRFVSVEDCRFGFEYIDTLAGAGYGGFKLLDQSTVPDLIDRDIGHRFEKGASGPFGDAVPGNWLAHAAMVETYATTVRDRAGNRLAPRTRWWDIHAAHA